MENCAVQLRGQRGRMEIMQAEGDSFEWREPF